MVTTTTIYYQTCRPDGTLTERVYLVEIRGKVLDNFERVFGKVIEKGKDNRQKGARYTIFEITEQYEIRQVVRIVKYE